MDESLSKGKYFKNNPLFSLENLVFYLRKKYILQFVYFLEDYSVLMLHIPVLNYLFKYKCWAKVMLKI